MTLPAPQQRAPHQYRLVETAKDLQKVISAVLEVEQYAIDTEFHREHTYYPSLALIQMAYGDQLVLIDPLKVDVSPLSQVFETDVLAVVHACSQDLEVLKYATGSIPLRVFDTQVAAAFLGYKTPSLAALHHEFLGVTLPKASQLTNWLNRPLKEAQIKYAASDVELLLDIAGVISSQLRALGRLGWAECECELIRSRGYNQRDPQTAWLRIKQARNLKNAALARTQALAQWREQSAQNADVPVRHILPDLAVISLSQQPPSDARNVTKARGLERRGVSMAYAQEIVEVLRGAGELPRPYDHPKTHINSKIHRPAVALISAWMNQFAKDIRIDTAMIGSRSDIEDFVRDPKVGRLSKGWRYDLVSQPILQLLEGDAALAFDGEGRIVVERRSFQPLLSDIV